MFTYAATVAAIIYAIAFVLGATNVLLLAIVSEAP